jgi:hypothetical protein
VARESCTICGETTDICCSDCAIDGVGQVYVCGKHPCQEAHAVYAHEEKHDPWTRMTVPEPKIQNLLCPKCGHVEGPPAEAGDRCPVCQEAEIETRLEAIDPEVLKALLPFAPEPAPPNPEGSLWLYKKQPIALPSSSTFKVLLKFGDEKQTPVEQFVNGLSDEPEKPKPPDTAIRVSLLGFYKNAVEIA